MTAVNRDLLRRIMTVDLDALPTRHSACEWPDCGTHEMTERHHFFPCAIYGDEFAERGPTAYYCQTHHNGWHQKVTPHISQRDAA